MEKTVESYLLDYHQRFPGITARTLAPGRVDASRSSYDVLCDVACAAMNAASPTPKPLLLDLGCGDGYLLEQLVHRGLEPAQLMGVDMSPDEVALARARPALAGTTLRCERAQEMSLAPASVTCVVSHGALVHMMDIEALVARLALALRPGGVLVTSCMDGAWPVAPNAFVLFIDLFDRIHDSVDRGQPVLLDPRIHALGGMDRLFGPHTGFSHPKIDSFELNLDGSPDAVWHTLSGLYEMARWSAAEVETLRTRFLAEVVSMRRADGTVPCRLRVFQLTCRRLQQPE